ncbi:unnamed protein product [Cladocopium goreaui]|uniref:N-alpha-acetyltransferase 10 (N-termina l acetyltransferase complex ARD1 subunit homolog A) (NatA catalytic subunit Naa10) n=1 Tax=Cladocopium goreaui TaxID=2562237 RepID=A0A9P1FJ02_9DINO|nr:unnamed protein product [Cladocopium goreaui]
MEEISPKLQREVGGTEDASRLKFTCLEDFAGHGHQDWYDLVDSDEDMVMPDTALVPEAQAGMDMWLRNVFAEGSRTSVDVVAEGASGRILGYCAYRFEGALQSPWLHLLGIAVDAQNRRRGLAQHLLRAALRGAAEAGASAALLHVRVENHAAQRLYRRLGFLRVARVQGYYTENDAWELLRELPAMALRPVDLPEVMKLRAQGLPRSAVERALRWTQNDLQMAQELAAGRILQVSGEALRETQQSTALMAADEKMSSGMILLGETSENLCIFFHMLPAMNICSF